MAAFGKIVNGLFIILQHKEDIQHLYGTSYIHKMQIWQKSRTYYGNFICYKSLNLTVLLKLKSFLDILIVKRSPQRAFKFYQIKFYINCKTTSIQIVLAFIMANSYFLTNAIYKKQINGISFVRIFIVLYCIPRMW